MNYNIIKRRQITARNERKSNGNRTDFAMVNIHNNPGRQGLWLTDFDGTIKPGGGPISAADLKALKHLGKLGWYRVVATGRSLFGFAKAWEPGLEFDALIFSSGAGLCAWGRMGPGPILKADVFETKTARAALAAAMDMGYAFFVFQAPPDNHHFYYRRAPGAPIGFQRRLEIYSAQCRPWFDGLMDIPEPFSQLMIMVPAAQAGQAEAEFRRRTDGTPLSVVKSSSPFSDGHIWLEIFPHGISKGLAAAALAVALGIPAQRSVALGNDYNDLDLLDWAGRAFITSDAPFEMVNRFQTMPPAGQGGLALAAEIVLSSGGPAGQ